MELTLIMMNFTPVINKSNCGNVDGVGMFIETQNTCSPSHIDYTEALRFMVTIDPSKSAQITGLQFAEQSPRKIICLWVVLEYQ